ncbi:MAG: hypothetical protein JW757_03490 [Anaerolineales bacterium]|nr:hypothetical protein [Anaerolineales bacterium]
MAFDNMDYDFDDQDDVFNQPLDFDPQADQEPEEGGIQVAEFFAKLTANPITLGAVALAIGLILGLVFAWGIWPVQYTDAAPEHLHENFQVDYMRMVVDSFTLRQDNALAKQRIDALGEDGPGVLEKLIQNPGDDLSRLALDLFLQQYNPGAVIPPAEPADDLTIPDAEAPAEEEEGSGTSLFSGSRTKTFLLTACGVTGLIAIAAAGYYFLRMRQSPATGQTAASRANEFSRQAVQTDYEAMGQGTPIAQWMTTYLIGDDLFDDSFSIDSLSGEFLGECGVGIADTIGVGEPKRVSAFEVWLFDKNDIQTVTKVVMSAHAMNDNATSARLAAKGEPVLAVPGETIELLTKTLRMAVRVMDMDYGAGHLPENSFFQRITLELAVWELPPQQPQY